MEKALYVKNLTDWDKAATDLLSYCKDGKIFAIYGDMGAGKTTFIQHICKALGVNNKVLSPTFSLINEYSNGQPVYHFDLYRLKDMEELLNIGITEYLDSGRYCFIEWPQIAEPLLPEGTVSVYIEADSGEERSIKIIN